jgi:hypothetical protein
VRRGGGTGAERARDRPDEGACRDRGRKSLRALRQGGNEPRIRHRTGSSTSGTRCRWSDFDSPEGRHTASSWLFACHSFRSFGSTRSRARAGPGRSQGIVGGSPQSCNMAGSPGPRPATSARRAPFRTLPHQAGGGGAPAAPGRGAGTARAARGPGPPARTAAQAPVGPDRAAPAVTRTSRSIRPRSSTSARRRPSRGTTP